MKEKNFRNSLTWKVLISGLAGLSLLSGCALTEPFNPPQYRDLYGFPCDKKTYEELKRLNPGWGKQEIEYIDEKGKKHKETISY